MEQAIGDKRTELSLRGGDRTNEEPSERRARSRGSLSMHYSRPPRVLEQRGYSACQVSASEAMSRLNRVLTCALFVTVFLAAGVRFILITKLPSPAPTP